MLGLRFARRRLVRRRRCAGLRRSRRCRKRALRNGGTLVVAAEFLVRDAKRIHANMPATTSKANTPAATQARELFFAGDVVAVLPVADATTECPEVSRCRRLRSARRSAAV